MQQKQITIKKLDVSYLEQNPDGKMCLFFVHGNSSSNKIWKSQFAAFNNNDYHLIAIDVPGHGASSFSKTPNKDYSVPALGKLMAEFITGLNLNKPYILCGFSLGTNIIAEMLAYKIDPAGLVLISPCLVGKNISPADLNDKEIVGEVLFNANEKEEQVNEYFDLAMPLAYISDKAELINDYLATDKQFRKALLETAINGEFSDEVGLINESKLPVLMIIGQQDEIVKPDVFDAPKLFHTNVNLVKITGGHYLPVECPETVKQLIADFVNTV